MEDNKCDHQWTQSGLWDGKDPNTGARTGGAFYRCKLCGKKVTSMEQVKALGGTYDPNTDVMGRPVTKSE